jgi:hypothetical protein
MGPWRKVESNGLDLSNDGKMGSSTWDVITLVPGKPIGSRYIEIDCGTASCVNKLNRT